FSGSTGLGWRENRPRRTGLPGSACGIASVFDLASASACDLASAFALALASAFALALLVGGGASGGTGSGVGRTAAEGSAGVSGWKRDKARPISDSVS